VGVFGSQIIGNTFSYRYIDEREGVEIWNYEFPAAKNTHSILYVFDNYKRGLV
jgi:hypothetical protein